MCLAFQSGEQPAGRIGERIVIPVGEVHAYARTIVDRGIGSIRK